MIELKGWGIGGKDCVTVWPSRGGLLAITNKSITNAK